ncbi:ataxin-3-like [Saccoglossus kowalevskii]|uniref:ubiquitinyl hydrolase 1 n=1 Tax=Saccoglossus kowalevskii TaxID=10224 RepID=A0ABM0GJC2_SACKO|nr:PREDICTED: ataxin-3-like [Saccoglossus kowalevskii]
MDAIVHETQDGSLCAQHCLNALLQGEYFTAVDLSMLARDLDEEERKRMAEGDLQSAEYLKFLEQPSGNMDDSGFFSVQVISSALSVWGLDLVPFGSEAATVATVDPTTEIAFICNYKEHWFTVRKLGRQWFNLNSLLTGPELVSDTYLSMFLAQLRQEGYSIFVVKGQLPECEANEVLQIIEAVQTQRPKLLSELQKQNKSANDGASTSKQHVNLDDLQKALKASGQCFESDQEEEDRLQEAIRLSMQGCDGGSASSSQAVDLDEVRQKRQAYFDRHRLEGEQCQETQLNCGSPELEINDNDKITSFTQSDDELEQMSTQELETTAIEGTKKTVSDLTEEEMLKIAMDLSMNAEDTE